MKSSNQHLEAIVAECVTRVAVACREYISVAAAQAIGAAAPSKTRALPAMRKPAKRARAGAVKRCYFPGCKNVAAPRFGMFCAALHKDLPPRRKDQIRAQRQ